MKKRPISLKVFKCMKCSTHFSQDTEYMTVITSSMSGMFINRYTFNYKASNKIGKV